MSYKSKVKFTFFVISSVFIALTLGYVNEGYRTSNWMANLDDWIKLTIYSFSIFVGQVICAKIIFSGYHGVGRVLLSLIGGLAVGIVLTMMLAN